MQLDYNDYLEEAYAGMFADSYQNTNVNTAALEFANIEFGKGVVWGTEEDTASPVFANRASIVFDADIITGNTISMDVQGDNVSVPFNTDHLTTMNDLITAIFNLGDDIGSEINTDDVTNRTITVVVIGAEAAVTNITVTGGASQAGSAVYYDTNGTFSGVVKHEHIQPQNNDSNAYYVPEEAIGVIDEGIVWVYVTEAVGFNQDALLVVGGDDKGKFAVTNPGNYIATGGKFKSVTTGAGIAKLKIKLS